MTTTQTPAARVSGTIRARADLLRDALRFAYLAAGEGIEIDGLAPEDFLMAYSVATGDEEWDTFADRLAAIQPDPEPVSTTKQNYGDCLSSDPETQPVAFGRQHFEPKRDSDRQPWIATPSSAGTVSVEAAAKALLEKCPNPIFDKLKPVLMGEVTERVGYTDEDGNEAYYDRTVSWDAMKTIIRAALRALAGEGER